MTAKLTALATVAAWSLALVLVGCIDTRTMPVEYGAHADPMAIQAALDAPTQGMKATSIKVGEFVAMETTQDVALGQSVSSIGATGATITDRAEDNDRIIYSGVLHQLTLGSDGNYSKVSREGEILCASKSPCACGECKIPESPDSSATSIIGVKAEPLMPAQQRKTLASQSFAGYKQPEKLLTAAASAVDEILVTYHQFSAWAAKEPPPANVASQPNCLGIPACLINVYHVNFDQVFWDTPKGTKVHVEAKMSPDVPFLSRNLSLCQSLLVNVGKDGSNVLLKQCSSVFDFRFQSE